MKMIEKAPVWREVITRETLPKILDAGINPQFADLINKCNTEYLYWDKFKYVYNSDLLPPESAWAFLKITRNTQIKKIALTDTQGRNFGYWLPDSLIKELHYLDQHASGEILVEDPYVPSGERNRFLISSLMEEAVASSQLEGAATTTKVAKEMLRSRRKPRNRSEQMIYNNYITIRQIKDSKDEPLSVGILKSLQASLTKDTLDDKSTSGRFRNQDEPIVVRTQDGDILHDPPPASELPKRVELLCNYANDNNKARFTHPVIKAIILHFWLAYDHPFVDGNGRTARALFHWYMLKSGYWLTEYISISKVIKRASSQYYRAFLYSEKDEQDSTYFLHFNLKAIRIAINEFRKYLSRKTKEVKEAESYLVRYPGLNYRQSQLLYHALTHPDTVYTFESHLNTYGVTYQTARTDLLGLVEKDLLVQLKKGKTYRFMPVDDLKKKLMPRARLANVRLTTGHKK